LIYYPCCYTFVSRLELLIFLFCMCSCFVKYRWAFLRQSSLSLHNFMYTKPYSNSGPTFPTIQYFPIYTLFFFYDLPFLILIKISYRTLRGNHVSKLLSLIDLGPCRNLARLKIFVYSYMPALRRRFSYIILQ